MEYLNNWVDGRLTTLGWNIGWGIGTAIAVVLVVLLGSILIWVSFIKELRNALRLVSEENRKMPSSQVWLLIIPIFNTIWNFIVINSISSSFELEFKKYQIIKIKPSYTIGLAYSILQILIFIPIVNIWLIIPYFLCFALYWINVRKLSHELNELKSGGKQQSAFANSQQILQTKEMRFQPQPTEDMLFNDALNFYNNGELDRALNLLQKGLQSTTNKESYINLSNYINIKLDEKRKDQLILAQASEQYSKNEFKRAYDTLTQMSGDTAESILLKNKLNSNISNIDKAHALYNESIRVKGKYIIRSLQLLQEAIELHSDKIFLDELADQNNDYKLYLYNKATSYIDSSKFREAVKELSTLSILDSNYKDVDSLLDDLNKKLSARTRNMIIASVAFTTILIFTSYIFYMRHQSYEKESVEWNEVLLASEKHSLNDTKIINNFIAEHPNGYFKNSAVDTLRSINMRDSLNWDFAIHNYSIYTTNNIEKYLQEFNDGRYRDSAIQILDSALYAFATDKRGLINYVTTMQNYPNAKHLNEVRNKLKTQSELEISSSEENEIKSNLNSFYAAIYSKNYEELLMHFPPVLSGYFGRRNIAKGDVVESIRKYVTANRISSERNNIDWTTFDAKHQTADIFIIKFNMDYYTKIDYPPSEDYYNVNVFVCMDKNYKIVNYNQAVISKNSHK